MFKQLDWSEEHKSRMKILLAEGGATVGDLGFCDEAICDQWIKLNIEALEMNVYALKFKLLVKLAKNEVSLMQRKFSFDQIFKQLDWSEKHKSRMKILLAEGGATVGDLGFYDESMCDLWIKLNIHVLEMSVYALKFKLLVKLAKNEVSLMPKTFSFGKIFEQLDWSEVHKSRMKILLAESGTMEGDLLLYNEAMCDLWIKLNIHVLEMNVYALKFKLLVKLAQNEVSLMLSNLSFDQIFEQLDWPEVHKSRMKMLLAESGTTEGDLLLYNEAMWDQWIKLNVPKEEIPVIALKLKVLIDLAKKNSKLAPSARHSTSKQVAKQKELLASATVEEKAFVSKFEGHVAKEILDRLKAYIEDCVDLWAIASEIYPMCSIIQSSGYGKTRCMYELANVFVTNYLSIRAHGTPDAVGVGFPKRSNDADGFWYALSQEASAFFLIYNWIDSTLERVKRIKNHVEPDQLASEYRKSQPWLDHKMPSYDKIETEEYDLDNLRMKLRATLGSEPIIFCIDEADVLPFEANDINRFKILKNTLKRFYSFRIMFVLIGTDSSLYDYRVPPSSRSMIKNPVPPFSSFVMTDCTVPKSYISDLEAIKNYLAKPTNSGPVKPVKQEMPILSTQAHTVFDFFNRRVPSETFLLFGRPLWHALLHNNTNLPVYKFLRNDYTCSLAYLALRTNLVFKFLSVNNDARRNLVNQLMATLVHLDPETGNITLHYVSEPVLADVAARRWYVSIYSSAKRDPPSGLIKILDDLISHSSSCLASLDDIGELVAQIILLLAKDNASATITTEKNAKRLRIEREEHHFFMSYPVTVEQFLKQLIGDKYYSSLIESSPDIPKEMREGIVCFSHFTQKLDDLSMGDVVKDFLGRNAAGIFKPNFEDYDFFIPVVCPGSNQQSTIGMLLFKVKNRVDKLTVKRLNELYESLNPVKVFKNSNLNLNNKNTISFVMDLVTPDDKESIGLNPENQDGPFVMSLGRGHPRKFSNRFIIMGHETKSYPCVDSTIGSRLGKLLSMSRSVCSRYNPLVQKTAFNGCFSEEYLNQIAMDRPPSMFTYSGRMSTTYYGLHGLK